MARETKVMVTCRCGRWWYTVGNSEPECERKLLADGWSLAVPEKCPECRKVAGRSAK